MSCKLNRSLGEQDVVTLITKSLFDSYRFSEDCRTDMYASRVDMYYASAAERIPSFEEMVDAGVFYLASVPPFVVSNAVVRTVEHKFENVDAKEETGLLYRKGYKDSNNSLFIDLPDRADDMEGTKEVLGEEDTVVMFDMSTYEHKDNGMFVDSWDHDLDDGTEYIVLFEEEDDTINPLPCGANVDCPDEVQDVSKVNPAMMEWSIRQWGAKVKVYNVNDLHWRGAIELEAYEVTATGERSLL